MGLINAPALKEQYSGCRRFTDTFDTGEYQDRRTNKMIDTSQFIWVLATNALDPVIMKFHDEHASVMSNENEKDEPVRTQLISSLSQQLRSAFTSALKVSHGKRDLHRLAHIPNHNALVSTHLSYFPIHPLSTLHCR